MYILLKDNVVSGYADLSDQDAQALTTVGEFVCLKHESETLPECGDTYSNGVFIHNTYTPVVNKELTHIQFRRLFSSTERELADELEATFESNPALSSAQKRTLRSGYKDFNAASAISLDDPGIPPMLSMYVALGILEEHRPAEILSRQPIAI